MQMEINQTHLCISLSFLFILIYILKRHLILVQNSFLNFPGLCYSITGLFTNLKYKICSSMLVIDKIAKSTTQHNCTKHVNYIHLSGHQSHLIFYANILEISWSLYVQLNGTNKLLGVDNCLYSQNHKSSTMYFEDNRKKPVNCFYKQFPYGHTPLNGFPILCCTKWHPKLLRFLGYKATGFFNS